MFLLTKPTKPTIQQFINDSRNSELSYPEINATRGEERPVGYNIDHNRIRLGSGLGDFEKAKNAIAGWKMFDMKWVRLCHADTTIEVGREVAIMVKHFGFYSINAARIVYVMDNADNVHRFGFAYGTLAEHGEIGEERFSVEFHEETGEVWYDLYAFSRPASLLARVGYPLSRYLQKSFAADSKRAMFKAVSGAPVTQQN